MSLIFAALLALASVVSSACAYNISESVTGKISATHEAGYVPVLVRIGYLKVPDGTFKLGISNHKIINGYYKIQRTDFSSFANNVFAFNLTEERLSHYFFGEKELLSSLPKLVTRVFRRIYDIFQISRRESNVVKNQISMGTTMIDDLIGSIKLSTMGVKNESLKRRYSWVKPSALLKDDSSAIDLDIVRSGLSGAAGYFKRLGLLSVGFSGLSARASLEQQVEPVATTGLPQSAVRLPNRVDQPGDRHETQRNCDDRPGGSASVFSRCFLSSEGGAPLGAQISGVIILSIVAGIGIVAAIGREFSTGLAAAVGDGGGAGRADGLAC